MERNGFDRSFAAVYLVLTSVVRRVYDADEHAEPLTEWEYLPPVGSRTSLSFVGLKNAGATCSVNSVSAGGPRRRK